MCTACTTAAQHFSSGSQPAQRSLQTSVEQGTSPDWHSTPHNGMNEAPDTPRFGAGEHDYR